MAADAIIEAKQHRVFAGTFCKLFGFEVELKKSDFRFEEFWGAMGKTSAPRFSNTCNSRSKSADYHLHLTWESTPDVITVTVEFARGYKAPEPEEKEPLADNFIEWLRQFTLVNKLPANIHSDFEFPNDPGRRMMFPLPLIAPVGPKATEVAIDGISFHLSPPVGGVEKVWITQGEKILTIHLHAERIIDFDTFDPHKEILEISGVLESMFKESKAKPEGKPQ